MDLVVPENFIRAVRESGYLNLSTALAELIDNSLQASASRIAIMIDRPAGETQPEIRVLDDGVGMDRAEAEACLRFGGTARFDDRGSFGRFGMGLPAASLSQARRVEVVAWQVASRPWEVALDVDAVAARSNVDFRARRSRYSAPTASGCLVVWRRCDRIEYKRLAWLERALRRDLGRTYRRYVDAGLDLTLNGSPIGSHDPLMLATTAEGQSATLAFEPLRYELSASDGATSHVEVRFTQLPVEAWHHLDNLTKRRMGIVGGGGVSIVRAGREIAFGWHLMGGKRRENYDDWWRCEIEFDPTLDEHFGITVNKQGIRPTGALREALEPELESIARLLNARVRRAFEDVKFRAASEISCRVAEAAEPDLPAVQSRGRGKRRGALSYRLSSDQISDDAMFSSNVRDNVLDVKLNVDHPAFAALYQPLQAFADDAGGSDLRTAIELLLLSFARVAAQAGTQPTRADSLIEVWSKTYARMLRKS